jgi:hypothetical protein
MHIGLAAVCVFDKVLDFDPQAVRYRREVYRLVSVNIVFHGSELDPTFAI